MALFSEISSEDINKYYNTVMLVLWC